MVREAPQAAEEAPQSPPKKTQRRKPPKLHQGPFLRMRLGFEKLGRAAYGSHLDLVRLFPRLFRQIDLPLFYSEGFHPKPVMTFSPALPLGVSSVAEYVDVKLRARDLESWGERPAEAVLARLNEVAMDGVTFTGAALLGNHDRAIAKLTKEALYVAAVPRRELPVSEAELSGFIAAKRSESLVVRREKKGIGRHVDIGPGLLEVEVGGAETLARAGLVGDLVPLRFRVVLGTPNTPRPREVVRALFGDAGRREGGAGAHRGDHRRSALRAAPPSPGADAPRSRVLSPPPRPTREPLRSAAQPASQRRRWRREPPRVGPAAARPSAASSRRSASSASRSVAAP